MRRRVFIILLLLIFAAGCARTAKIRRLAVSEVVHEEISEPESFFTVGEKFTYLVAWKGIPVGCATSTIEELTTFKEYRVYKIVLRAETNKFLSKLFKVNDTFTTYMDKNKLISRRYEAVIREGRYRKDLVVDYDFKKSLAIYKNLTDGSVNTCPVDKNVQDPVSAAYFVRTIPVAVGNQIKMSVNLNQKNYEVFANIEKRRAVTLPETGTFDAFLIRPYVKLNGEKQRRGNSWGYLSADKKRLGLFAVVKVLEIPWIGDVTATLEKVEYAS